MMEGRCWQSPLSMAAKFEVLVLSCLFLLTPSRGQVDLKENVEQATEKLAMRFEEIRSRVLGVDELAVRIACRRERVHLLCACVCAYMWSRSEHLRLVAVASSAVDPVQTQSFGEQFIVDTE